jgi:uncharacterized membrane protein YvlD (DUF360 family)
MNYLKSLVINFLVVFFSDHILPGIQVVNQTKLPHIGGDMILAAALGVLNSLIYPVLKLIHTDASALKIALIALILNFAAYGLVKLLPIGVNVLTVEGYILASAVVTIGSFLTNYFARKPPHPSQNTETL